MTLVLASLEADYHSDNKTTVHQKPEAKKIGRRKQGLHSIFKG